jgi:hypothetical protein
MHADECLSVLLRVRKLRSSAKAQAGRLLRLLFVRLRQVPAGSVREGAHVDRDGNLITIRFRAPPATEGRQAVDTSGRTSTHSVGNYRLIFREIGEASPVTAL